MKPDITLIFPSSPFLLNQAVFPPLGILYLSAYLKENGLDVQCLDMGLGHTLGMIEAETVGVSFSTPQRLEAFRIADELAGKKWLIAGGPHPTHMPDECYEHGFSSVIRGYGERGLLETMKVLVSSVKQTKVNLLDARFNRKIDEYPFPDRDALPIKDYSYEIDGTPATVLMTSRGCPYDCAFCARVDKGFEMQSAGRTVAEIEHIHERYGFEAFMVFDDIFIASKRRLGEMVDAIGGRYKFRCFARANLIDDWTCELMNRLGVVEAGIGVESGSGAVLNLNMKGTTPAMNMKAVQTLKKHGIRAKTFLIVGLPGESRETISETEAWIQRANPDDLDISVFQPLPGSRIFADPQGFGVKFNYNGAPGWYKGIPGRYAATASTEFLSAAEIVELRDSLERKYKNPAFLR